MSQRKGNAFDAGVRGDPRLLEAISRRTPKAAGMQVTHTHSGTIIAAKKSRRNAAAAAAARIPITILSSRPPHIAAPVTPVSPPAKRYYIEWGTVNEIVATNWEEYFDISSTKYFFAEINFVSSEAFKVASWQVITGADYASHVTPDWDVGDPRPAKMIILLGIVMVNSDGAHIIIQNGGGSFLVGEQITSITSWGGGAVKLGKQLVYQRINHA